MSWDRELGAVLRWLDETDAIAMAHWRVGVASERKGDGTPVTEADRGIEAALRGSIEREFGGDAVLGEEQGETRSGAARRWIVDPIDATKNFRRGIPVFGTLVALEAGGALVLGAVSAPALGTRWWATRGGGAFRDGEPIRVSGVADLGAAQIASGGLETLREQGLLEGFLSLCGRADSHRAFGDFWGHMLVAQGSIEAMVDPLVAPWDVAAPALIVAEAGGRTTSARGEAGIEGGSAVSTNGRLHEAVLEALGG